MGVCMYFQSGNCRFGSRCNNDHVDLRNMVKTEIEVAVKGKQWPLSTFGPFKEKPSMANLIEDMCFEEVRFACYEAQKQNNLPGHQMQLMELINDANNKLQSVMTLSKEMYQNVVDLYNAPEEPAIPQNDQQKPANPFAANLGQTTATGGPSNIFGSSGFSSNTGSIFGGVQPVGNQSTTGNMFSQVTQPQQPSSGQNIFGMSSNFNQTTTQQPSIFNSPSTFGGGVAQQQQSTNIFTQPAVVATGNIFQQASSIQPQGNIFQQAPQPLQQSNIFQQAPQQQNPFPVAPSQGIFGGVTGPQQSSSPFNSQMNNTPIPSSGSPFVQVPQQPQGIFSSVPTQMPFGAQPPPLHPGVTQFSETIYTKIDQLTKEQLESFQSDNFVLGKIPTCPPPKELC